MIIEALDLMADPPVLVVVGEGPERARLEADGCSVFGPGHFHRAPPMTNTKLPVIWRYRSSSCFRDGLGSPASTDSRPAVPASRPEPEASTKRPEFDYVNQDNSIVVERLDPQMHAEAVTRLLGDAELLADLRKGAISTAQRLRIDAMVDGYAAAVEFAVRSKA